MDHNQPLTAFSYAMICAITGMFASILNNVEILVRIGSGSIAIASGLMAIRHFYYSTKKIKEDLKNKTP